MLYDDRQITGAQTAIETAKTLIIIIRTNKWTDVDELIEIVKSKGKLLIDAQSVGMLFWLLFLSFRFDSK